MDTQKRIAWLDAARGYGMFLVFYGHLVERFADLGHPGSFSQFKFVYAFHMPLFFVLSGVVARPSPGILYTAGHGLLTRILPAVFFNLLLMVAWLPPFPMAETPAAQQKLSILLHLFAGRPVFNFLTWFLFCLFTVELIHAVMRRFVRGNAASMASIVLLFAIGQWVTLNLGAIVRVTGVQQNVWMIHEALVAAGFHQLGFLLAGKGLLDWRPRRSVLLAVCASAWVAVALSFDLNVGPFHWRKPVVLMALSSHGNPLLFPLTALLGTAGVVTLAMLTTGNGPARWIGKHSLIFLGLNAVFVLSNRAIAIEMQSWMDGTPVLDTVFLCAATVMSLAVTAPVAAVIARGLPQLVGHPAKSGPLLPALTRRADRAEKREPEELE